MNIIAPGTTWSDERAGVLPTSDSKFTLSDLSSAWHFFTHGALFTYAGFAYPHEDPVADWYVQQPRDTVLIQQPHRRPIFAGLDGPVHSGLTWNHIVCAVRHHQWPDLLNFLNGLCSIDREKGVVCRTFSGDIDILDPVLVERHSILTPGLPRVKVTVICVDGNKDRWEIHPAASPVGEPRMERVEPRVEIVEVADALLRGDFSAAGRLQSDTKFQQRLENYKNLQFNGSRIIAHGN